MSGRRAGTLVLALLAAATVLRLLERRRRPQPVAGPGVELRPWAPSERQAPVAGASRRSRRRAAAGWIAAAAAVAVALVAATAVFAYTSGSGVGVGFGSVDSSKPLTIAPGTAVHALVPGESADVVATISNPNPVPIHLPALDLDPAQGTTDGFSVDAAHASCNLSSLRFNGPQSDGGASFVVPADGTLHVDLAGAVSMDTTATAACQGATLTVYLKVVP